ncbi:MAG: lipoyl(octanoyl) transferase LipB [Burkholderiales bacterium]
MSESVTNRAHSRDLPAVRSATASAHVTIRRLGTVEYAPTWQAMKQFTTARTVDSADELWLLQHPPVYTLGLAARAAHLPRSTTAIPVIKSDRGGQITYHGPGQIVVYTLVDLRRLRIGVRQLVRRLERSVIDLMGQYGIDARGREQAPGVYVDDAKIAALGLRIRNGCSYHGLSLNVGMDLAPFADIDPCGYPGLRVSQLREFGVTDEIDMIGEKLLTTLQANLWDSRPEMENR